MKRKPLERWEQALLFQYLLNKGLPPWAEDERVAFARLLNITQNLADAAYEELVKLGYVEAS